MKIIFNIPVTFYIKPVQLQVRRRYTDSFKALMLQKPGGYKPDFMLMADLASQYHFFNPDSAIILVQQAIELAQKIKYISERNQRINCTWRNLPKPGRVFTSSGKIIYCFRQK